VRRQLEVPQEAFVVALLGKYVERKRPADLVRAVADPQLRSRGIWAVLIGEGPTRPEIEALVATLNAENVRLTGFVNQSQIPSHLAASDLLAVTSSYDPHPLAVTEGATFGLPIVAADSIGCVGETDTARPNQNAIVYRTGDVSQLQAAIVRLQTDRDLYRRMSAKSSEIAKSQGVEAATDAFVAAIRSLHALGPRHSIRRAR
jgi:glycosyltransferase involved in cell wall biosynthesis